MFLMFYKNSLLSIAWNESALSFAPSTAIRLCPLKSYLFLLLTKDQCLYTTHLYKESLKAILNPVYSDVKDVQFCKSLNQVFIITNHGKVFSQSLEMDTLEMDKWQHLTFKTTELTNNDDICIKRMTASTYGILFVSYIGEIYALGKFSKQININCKQPQPLTLFKNQTNIIDLAAGDDFFIFLTQIPQEFLYSATEFKFGEDRKANSHYNQSSIADNIQMLIKDGATLLHTTVQILGSKQMIHMNSNHVSSTLRPLQNLNEVGVCGLNAVKNQALLQTVDCHLYHLLNIRCTDNLNSPTVNDIHRENADSFYSNDELGLQMNCFELYYGDGANILLNAQQFYKDDEGMRNKEALLTLKLFNSDRRLTSLLLSSNGLTIYNRLALRNEFYIFHYHILNQLKIMMCHYRRYRCLDRINNASFNDLQPTYYKHWKNIICLLILIQSTVEKFYVGDLEQAAELIFIKFYREAILIFEAYVKIYCDTYSTDNFEEFKSNFETTISSSPSIHDNDDIDRMFQQPFQIYSYFIQILEYLKKCDKSYDKELSAWSAFARQSRIDLELAENTRDFWRTHSHNIKIVHFKTKDRRVVLSSKVVPLRQSRNMHLIQPTFVLFSDCLSIISNPIVTFPLVGIWLKKENSTGIRILTPEKDFLLTTRNEHDRELWYDQLTASIQIALNINSTESDKLPEVRCIEYQFPSGHTIYSGVYAKGVFINGILHGKCNLQFPDGRLYAGEVQNGVIEGFGRMFDPKLGLFSGTFRNGKFSGSGTLIMGENEVYEGYFSNGLFHGHGHLQQAENIYIGGFENNMKSGYGVLDNHSNGVKYLGMFAENKKHGNGICITSMGDYIEGAFANNDPIGKCVALFQNHSYYEGELTLNGPIGNGKYVIPTMATRTQQYENAGGREQIIGNILSGQLAGSWSKIRISSGNLHIDCSLPKYPSSLGSFVVGNELKWSALFLGFEMKYFAAQSAMSSENVPNSKCSAWHRVIDFIGKYQEIRRDKSEYELQIQNHKSYQNETLKQFANYVKQCRIFSMQFDQPYSTKGDNIDNYCKYYQYQQPILNSKNKKETEATPLSCNIFADNITSNMEVSHGMDLNVIPEFGMGKLSHDDYASIKSYLKNAFASCCHPFYYLLQSLTIAFYRSYGCWRVKPAPLLSKIALFEWDFIAQRIYQFIQKLFPSLPTEYCVMEGVRSEIISYVTLLYPIIWSENIHSVLLVLYASKCNEKDQFYRQNILRANKLNDLELIYALDLDSNLITVINKKEFMEAINILKQLNEKFNPLAMFEIIENCFTQLTKAYQSTNNICLNADVIMPLTLVLILRADVPRFDAHFAFLDDLMENKHYLFEMNGRRGYCYTTLKASYEHISQKLLFEFN